ncbi:hypothetical protein HKX48_006432 [Thoreauomyces humboldtii]|nr:hypothetical protein HKX48_006432 [Thoreauomyces humboldtii]
MSVHPAPQSPTAVPLMTPGAPLKLASAKRAVIGTVGFFSKIFVNAYCKTHTINEQRLFRTVLDNRDRPLITVANHSSVLDDPGMWGTKISYWWDAGAEGRQLISTSMCGPSPQEICFGNRCVWRRENQGPIGLCRIPSYLGRAVSVRARTTAWFFASGRVIPIVRGDGIHQPGMDLAVEKLNENGWVHIFSEGKVNQESTMLPFRWGIARLIMESKVPPIVLPFWHKGFENVMPEPKVETDKYYPRARKELILSYGEPVDFASNGVLEQTKEMDDAAARIHITDYIFNETVKVQKDTERMLGDPLWRKRGKPQLNVDSPRTGDPA